MRPLAFTLLLAAIPGLYAWLDGRRVLRHRDDAVLAEMWTAHGARATMALVASLAVIVVSNLTHSGWGTLLASLGALAGRYPARRVIFEETWSLPAYVGHVLRLFAALAGPWILLVSTPLWMASFPGHRLWILVSMTLILLGWAIAWPRTVVRLLRARPLDEPRLQPFFERVLSKASCPRPRLLRAGAPGGRFVNAFALPAPGVPSILISDGLMDALTPEETTAIFAHEVAHLEEIDPRRWTARMLAPAAIALVLSAIDLTFAANGHASSWMLLAWPVAALMFLAGAIRHTQRLETESDVRAVELCGDAGALARALTRLHQLARQPRRMPAAHERGATHPSLAARLRVLERLSSGSETEPCVDPGAAPSRRLVMRLADDVTQAVVLHDDRLQWLQGLPVDADLTGPEPARDAARAESLRYSELIELRLTASRPDQRELVAVERGGCRRRVRVRPEDAAVLQDALDGIDAQLGSQPPAPLSRLASPVGARLLALAAICAGMLPPWNFALSAAALVMAIWPGRTSALAAAIAGTLGLLATMLPAARLSWPAEMQPAVPFSLLQAGLSLVLVLLAVLHRRLDTGSEEHFERRVFQALMFLATLAALLGLGPVAMLPGFALSSWLQTAPTALLLLAAAGITYLARERSSWPAQQQRKATSSAA